MDRTRGILLTVGHGRLERDELADLLAGPGSPSCGKTSPAAAPR